MINCSKGAAAADLGRIKERSIQSIENDLKIVEDKVRYAGAVIVGSCPDHLSLNEKFEECIDWRGHCKKLTTRVLRKVYKF